MLFMFILYLISPERQFNKKNDTSQDHCKHDWEPIYNAKEAAQIYNDGFNAYTDRYECNKCGKKKKGEKYFI